MSLAISQKRLKKEAQQMSENTINYIQAAPTENLYEWKCSIKGPVGTPYEGGKFMINMKFTESYPLSAPRCTFQTKIYHCNINTLGDICLNILKGDWKAAFGVESVLLTIHSLLSQPNPDDPLMLSVARMYTTQRERHDEIAKRWTEVFCDG